MSISQLQSCKYPSTLPPPTKPTSFPYKLKQESNILQYEDEITALHSVILLQSAKIDRLDQLASQSPPVKTENNDWTVNILRNLLLRQASKFASCQFTLQATVTEQKKTITTLSNKLARYEARLAEYKKLLDTTETVKETAAQLGRSTAALLRRQHSTKFVQTHKM